METLAIFYDGKRLHGSDSGRDRQLVLALNVATGVAGVRPLQAIGFQIEIEIKTPTL